MKLSCIGFRLTGVPARHLTATANGVYSKTTRMEKGRFVYEHIEGHFFLWHDKSAWLFSEEVDIGGSFSHGCIKSLSACPSRVSKEAQWFFADTRGNQLVYERMEGMSITALTTATELELAQKVLQQKLSESLEQVAPAFVISGLPADHLVINRKTRLKNDIVDAMESGATKTVFFRHGGQRCGKREIGDGQDQVVFRTKVLSEGQRLAFAIDQFVLRVKVTATGSLESKKII